MGSAGSDGGIQPSAAEANDRRDERRCAPPRRQVAPRHPTMARPSVGDIKGLGGGGGGGVEHLGQEILACDDADDLAACVVDKEVAESEGDEDRGEEEARAGA